MRGNPDTEGRDLEVESFLRRLDPATSDPHYWFRFQSWVLKNAGPELARRRLMAELTVGDVLSAWARTLLPVAAVAAALAGLFLLRPTPGPVPVAVGVEELLVAGMEDETIPVVLDADYEFGAVSFAGERF